MEGHLIVLGAVAVLIVCWLALLTVSVLRWRRQRGWPVYKRLPDGRLRFEWSVATAFASTQRSDAVRRSRSSR